MSEADTPAPKKRQPQIPRPRLGAEEGRRNDIGHRVKQRRLALGLTQSQLQQALADATDGEWDPSIQQVLYIESKRRAVTDLEIRVLARVLKCGASWLLEGDRADVRADVGGSTSVAEE